jgi:predicted nucleotidyltransferase
VTLEARTRHDYGERETEAARRVLVDLGQVLGSFFRDAVVVVGGWVPDLLIPDAAEMHVGSIDVDLALDVRRLRDGRYAEIVNSLLATRRYETTAMPFRLRANVTLGDGGSDVVVDVDFLKEAERRRRHDAAPLLPDFRPLDADACAAAFVSPALLPLDGRSIAGTENRVQLRVASVPSFLVMKAYALAGRDKPKDAYDFCYCLEHAPGGVEELAAAWNARRQDRLVTGALKHLREKFSSVSSYGPRQVAVFFDETTTEARDMRARRAFELVARFVARLDGRRSPS